MKRWVTDRLPRYDSTFQSGSKIIVNTVSLWKKKYRYWRIQKRQEYDAWCIIHLAPVGALHTQGDALEKSPKRFYVVTVDLLQLDKLNALASLNPVAPLTGAVGQ